MDEDRNDLSEQEQNPASPPTSDGNSLDHKGSFIQRSYDRMFSRPVSWASPVQVHPPRPSEPGGSQPLGGAPGSPFAKPSKASLKDRFGNLRKSYKKHRLKYLLAGGGIGGSLFFILLILFLLGTLLIPHFLSDVLGWQFTRLTRAARESNNNVMEEQEAIASADDANYDAMKSAFANNDTFKSEAELTPDAVDEVTAQLSDEGARINAILDGQTAHLAEVSRQQAAELDQLLQFREDAVQEGIGGRTRLQSLSFYDLSPGEVEHIYFNKGGGTFESDRLKLPPALTDEPKLTDDADLDFNASVQNVDPAEGADPLYASEPVQNDILGQELGTTDGGENPDEFNGKTGPQANGIVEKDSFDADNNSGGVGTSGISPIDNAETAGEQDLQQAVSSPSGIAAITAEDGNLPSALVKRLANLFTLDTFNSVVKKLGDLFNPFSGKLLQPLCIIYMGSKVSQPTAQAQSTEVQREAVFTMAVGDQQKRGSPYFNGTMGGAWNWKINGGNQDGGVEDSIPVRRAAGEKVSTTSQMSTEGAAFGNVDNTPGASNILNALGFPGSISGPLSGFLDHLCPVVTNIWSNLGLGIANLTIGALIGGGAPDAAESAVATLGTTAGEDATTAATDTVVEDALEEFGSSSIANGTTTPKSGFDLFKDLGTHIKATAKGIIVQGGLTAGITFLAKIFVLVQMGALHDGLPVGIPYDDDVDNGVNQISNQIVAQEYGGRPLTNSEAMQVQQDDNHLQASFNQSQSLYTRYLALSNPSSLATIIGDRLASNLNHTFFSSILNEIGNIFDPASLMPQILFGHMNAQASAATSLDTVDYLNLQRGYSDSEYATVNSTASYRSPSENTQILQHSNDLQAIQQTYGPCFSDQAATLLTTSVNGVPDVVRDGTGDVNPTEGLCSPQNLGLDNPKYGDMVFRYRLWLGYNTSINTYSGIAHAT